MRSGTASLILLLPCLLATADPTVTQAAALERRGKVLEAERLLRKALDSGDDTAEIRGALGLLLYRAGRFGEATPELARAAQLQPNVPEYSLKLAGSILGEKRYGVARDLLAAVGPRFEHMAEYQYNVGLAAYGVRDLHAAETGFRRALEINPAMDLAHTFLGNVYALNGKFPEALASYRVAARLNARHAGYPFLIGKILYHLGPENDAEAKRWLRKALELKPGDPATRFSLALALSRTGELQAARKLLEAVVQLLPNELEPHIVLARIYQEMELYELARSEREAIERLTAEGRTAKRLGTDPTAGIR